MLIGLCGYAGSGKDEAARALTDQDHWQRVAFADAVRAFAYAINPIVDSAGEHGLLTLRLQELVDRRGWLEAKKYKEVRRLLQAVGTEGGRKVIDPNVWVSVARSKWRQATFNGFNAIVTDVRFPNEVSAIREDGGQLWRIVRPGVGPVNDHCSETIIDDIDADVVISNDGDVERLHGIVRRLTA